MALLARTIVGFALVSTALIACADIPIVEPPPPPATTDDPKANDKSSTAEEPINDADKNLPVQASELCTDACVDGAKRCSATANAGTEICTKNPSGCLVWTQGSDCSAGTSCDKAKNDGTCAAGCKSDAGCSAANLGAETCVAEGGRSLIKCTKVDTTCFQWATVPSCSPDEVCRSGQCKPACTDACTLGALQCTGSRSRQQCTKAATGCTVWTSTQSCSPDETCTSGSCT